MITWFTVLLKHGDSFCSLVSAFILRVIFDLFHSHLKGELPRPGGNPGVQTGAKRDRFFLLQIPKCGEGGVFRFDLKESCMCWDQEGTLHVLGSRRNLDVLRSSKHLGCPEVRPFLISCQGESGADVYDRVSSFMESLFRELERNVGGCLHVIHGLSCGNRGFIGRFCFLGPEGSPIIQCIINIPNGQDVELWPWQYHILI